MQSLIRAVRSQCRITSDVVSSSPVRSLRLISSSSSFDGPTNNSVTSLPSELSGRKSGHECASAYAYSVPSLTFFNGSARFAASHMVTVSATVPKRCFSTAVSAVESSSDDSTAPELDVPTRIKFKRLDKTARNIMQILDREAVEDVKAKREIPDIKPGYIIQLKLEVPENKRRITTIKGIVIARRNAGLNTTFRLRRLVAGVGVESLLPLYSPNIKEIKVLDKKKVRRAKLYYLREKMNPLRR